MSTFDFPGYSIIKPLDAGGMATVYLAEQKSLGRQVAIKVMADHLSKDPTFAERFEQEAKIASHLNHPNIVTIFDYGSISSNANGSTLYLVMSFVDGQELKTLQPKLSLVTRLKIIQDIAQALNYAHDQGVIHRDIKPQNILVERKGSRAQLTDFGIAKAHQSNAELTQTGMTLGTPHYMAPEQALGKPVDHRADIYSLGVVLYFLLTGNVPYDGESEVAIGIKHFNEPIPQLPDMFHCFQPVLDKALAKEPSERYQTAGEFAEAVGQVSIGNLATLVQSISDESEAQTRVTPTIQPKPTKKQASPSSQYIKYAAGIVALVFMGIGLAFTAKVLFSNDEQVSGSEQTTPPHAIQAPKLQQVQTQQPETQTTQAQPAQTQQASQQESIQSTTKDTPEYNYEAAQDIQEAKERTPTVDAQTENLLTQEAAAANNARVTEVNCSYTLVKDWGQGWEAEILLFNGTEQDIEAWQVQFSLPAGTQLTNAYVTQKEQDGSQVTLTPHDWNKTLKAGQEMKLGFQGSGQSASTLNDLNCP